MRIIFFLLVFLLLGAFFIISNNNLHLKDSEEFKKFGDIYYSWLSGLFDNFKSLTSYVVKSEWLPSNNSR